MTALFYTRQGGWTPPPLDLSRLPREVLPAGHPRLVDRERAADLSTPPAELTADERDLRRAALRRAVREGEVAAEGLKALDAYEARLTVEVQA